MAARQFDSTIFNNSIRKQRDSVMHFYFFLSAILIILHWKIAITSLIYSFHSTPNSRCFVLRPLSIPQCTKFVCHCTSRKRAINKYEQRVIRHSYHGHPLLSALVETIGQRAYFSVEKIYCWRLFNLASLNISEKVKFAKFAKCKGTLNIRDLQYIINFCPLLNDCRQFLNSAY